MKIPRPREVERPFRRSRAPPVQATKLLLASMSAGLILIVVLAVVFIPRALSQEGKPPIPQIKLVVSSAGNTAWANVTLATVAAQLGDYNTTIVRVVGSSEVSVGALAALANGATNGGLTFNDVDGNGVLSRGDSFDVATQPGSTYTLHVWYLLEKKLVGIAQWPS